MDVTDEYLVHVGSRVKCDGEYATVRYIGEVQGTPGNWYGLEWDNADRGKHNGSKDGVQYFKTSNMKAGSFVRPKKIHPGVSFVQAVHTRYGKIEDEGAGVVEEDLFVVGKGKQTKVEMVGAKSVNLQQSDFTHLREVVLKEEDVSHAGPKKFILSNLCNLSVVDISKCLISSWVDIADITVQLKKLSSLNASDNRIEVPANTEVLSKAFLQLKTVFLNRSNYNWSQIMQCAAMWPKLEVLHACFNSISHLTNPQPYLQNIKLLNLESNPIQKWENLFPIGYLPKLEELILNNCDIENIKFPDVDFHQTTAYFPAIKRLSLSHNKIDTWASINELTKLALFEDLKFRFNPLITKHEHDTDVWQIAIARLPKLKLFNRSEVTSDERKGAELDYLKMNGTEWKSSGGNQIVEKNNPSAQFSFDHPMYQNLINKYGPPEDSELVKYTYAIKNTLIEISIDSPNLPEKPPMKKKFPGTMTVLKLKSLLQRLYKANPGTVKLTYTSKKMIDKEIEFESNMREISFYGIEDGDVLHVHW